MYAIAATGDELGRVAKGPRWTGFSRFRRSGDGGEILGPEQDRGAGRREPSEVGSVPPRQRDERAPDDEVAFGTPIAAPGMHRGDDADGICHGYRARPFVAPAQEGSHRPRVRGQRTERKPAAPGGERAPGGIVDGAFRRRVDHECAFMFARDHPARKCSLARTRAVA